MERGTGEGDKVHDNQNKMPIAICSGYQWNDVMADYMPSGCELNHDILIQNGVM